MNEPEIYFHFELKKDLLPFFDKISQLMGRVMPKEPFLKQGPYLLFGKAIILVLRSLCRNNLPRQE